MALLQAALSSPNSTVVGASILWSKLLRGQARVPAIFADFAPAVKAPRKAAPACAGRTAPTLLLTATQRSCPAATAKDPAALQAAMLALVAEVVESMLGVDVPADQPLMEAGLDSLGECQLAQWAAG